MGRKGTTNTVSGTDEKEVIREAPEESIESAESLEPVEPVESVECLEKSLSESSLRRNVQRQNGGGRATTSGRAMTTNGRVKRGLQREMEEATDKEEDKEDKEGEEEEMEPREPTDKECSNVERILTRKLARFTGEKI